VPRAYAPGRQAGEMFRHRSIRAQRVSALADEDLMALAQDGEARAYEVIFDRHAGAAFSLAYRMCGRRALAEEVVQDAFLSLWRSAGRYDPSRGSVRSWVLTVVHNRSVDTFRREIVRGEDRSEYDDSIAEQLPARDDTDAEVERREDATRVRRALTDLPSDQRRVIELAYFGGYTHSEIAGIEGLPPGTVKGRMRLGLTKLRLALGGSIEAFS
ncbi:MAG TPA: sigma-70 family RNA polymerase sigma factor, partial [Solirubrobacteraceae bacterium]